MNNTNIWLTLARRCNQISWQTSAFPLYRGKTLKDGGGGRGAATLTQNTTWFIRVCILPYSTLHLYCHPTIGKGLTLPPSRVRSSPLLLELITINKLGREFKTWDLIPLITLLFKGKYKAADILWFANFTSLLFSRPLCLTRLLLLRVT